MSLSLSCPQCERQSQVQSLVAADGVVDLECPACRAQLRVSGAGVVEVTTPARLASSGTEARPAMVCPKCDLGQPVADACRRCGLLRRHMPDFRAPADDGDLGREWAALDASWNSDDAHEQFLERAVASGDLSGAARLYRRRAANGDERAARYLERVGHMAVALVTSASVTREAEAQTASEPYKQVLLVLVVLVLAGGLLGAWFILGVRPSEAPAPVPAHLGPPATPAH